MKVVVNIARFVIAITFLFSGFVKAVDPLGTQYKMHDYLEAMGFGGLLTGDWVLLGGAVTLSATEFVLGVLLLFAISRRLVTKIVLVMMVVMTCLTVWIYAADPVEDCGCFGDALVLTNGETLAKNIVLLALAVPMAWKPLLMPRFISIRWQWITYYTAVAAIICLSAYSLYYLPLIDFRPYKVGADILALMAIPEGAEEAKYETTFILEKDGEQKEFTLDDYPDSTWTFVDSKTKMISRGYVPPIHDLEIQDARSGEDITDTVLTSKGYTLLLIAHHLEQADDSHFGEIDQLYEWSKENGVAFYCLTASGHKGIEQWIKTTGAEYPFCNVDETTLKTMVRSNPGLMLLKGGKIMGKWSHNNLPEAGSLLLSESKKK
ncbi:MAG: DoxX family protein [Prevotella sp.]|nr:DoxX family protein [Prevotella sp.]